jgi:hypothetical protein
MLFMEKQGHLLTIQIMALVPVTVVNSFAGMVLVFFDQIHPISQLPRLQTQMSCWHVHLFQVALLTHPFDVGMGVALMAHVLLAAARVLAKRNDAKMELVEPQVPVHSTLGALSRHPTTALMPLNSV